VLIVGEPTDLAHWIEREITGAWSTPATVSRRVEPGDGGEPGAACWHDAVIVTGESPTHTLRDMVRAIRASTQAPIAAITPDERSGDLVIAAGASEILPLDSLNGLLLRRTLRMMLQTHNRHGHFQSLVEKSVDGMLMLDPEGVIIYANPAAAQLMNRDVPTLLGEAFGIPAFDGDWIEVNLGPETVAEMRVHAIDQRDPPAVAISLRDVSARYAADRALRESEAHYRDLVENQPQLIHRYLPDTTETFVNRAFQTFFGVDESGILNQRWIAWLPEQEQTATWRHLENYTLANPIQTYQNTATRHDGVARVTRWTNRAFFDDAGRITHFQAVGADVTEEVMARREIEASEARFRAVFDQSPLGKAIMDMDGTAEQVNPAMARMLGRAPEDLRGTDLLGATHPDDLDNMRQRFRDLQCGRRTMRNVEQRVIRANGDALWVRIDASLLPEESNHGQRRIIALFEDITERKMADKAVRDANRRLDLLLRSTGEGICGVDQDGRLIFTNPAAERLLGYSFEEIRGQRMHDLAHHSHATGIPYPADLCPIHRTLRDGQEITVDDEVFWRRDGTSFEVAYTANPVLDETGTIEGAVVVFQDITERRAIERQNESNLERLEIATASAGLGVWEWHDAEQRFQWDDQMLRLYGLSRESFTGDFEDWRQRVLPQDLDKPMDAFGKLIRGASTRLEREFRIRRPDGAVRSIRASGQREKTGRGHGARLIGLCWDVTDTRSVESQLRQEKAFSDHVVAHSPHLVVGGTPDGILTFMNYAAERATGYSMDELIGQSWWSTMYPGQHYEQVTRLFRKLDEEGAVREYPMTLIRKDGEARTIAWTTLNRVSISGEIQEMVGYGRDITAEHQVQAQQQQEDKLRALGEMAGGMAHEINNALQPIVGVVGILAERAGETDAKVAERLGILEQHALYARKIVSDVLAFARMEGPEATPFDAMTLLEDVTDFVRRITPSRIVLRGPEALAANLVRGDGARILVNRNGMIQVLQNLVSNAVDAMDGMGTIDIVLDAPAPEDRVPEIQGDQIRIDIADHGPGMDEPTKRDLFDPFFSTKPVGKGTGLGLSVVYGLISHWGGTVRVDSAPGEGTTVRLYLPVATETLTAEAGTPVRP
jgi:PAS domain S-box-containing protein